MANDLTIEKQLSVIEPMSPPVAAGFFDAAGFDLIQRIAKGFSMSTLVPQDYRGGSPAAIGNCMIALNLARRIGADPLMVMQNLSIIQGRPSWSSQFLIASVNTCGRFSALRFEFFGEKGQPDWGCRASAVERATGEVLTGSDITWKLAVEEGWTKRGGSKWQTMPQQMFIYRSGAWWVKAYAPEISMGLMTADESHDVGDVEYREMRRDSTPPIARAQRSLSARATDAENVKPLIDDEIPERLLNFPVKDEATDHDPETGEIIDPPAAEAEKPKRGRKTTADKIAEVEAGRQERMKRAEEKKAPAPEQREVVEEQQETVAEVDIDALKAAYTWGWNDRLAKGEKAGPAVGPEFASEAEVKHWLLGWNAMDQTIAIGNIPIDDERSQALLERALNKRYGG